MCLFRCLAPLYNTNLHRGLTKGLLFRVIDTTTSTFLTDRTDKVDIWSINLIDNNLWRVAFAILAMFYLLQFLGYCLKGLHFSFPQTIADIAENRPFGFVHNCNLYFFCKFDFVFMYFCLTCQGCMLLRMGPLFSILRHQRPFSGPSHTLTGEQASNSLEISVLACLIYLDTWKIIKLDPYPSFLISVPIGSFIALI